MYNLRSSGKAMLRNFKLGVGTVLWYVGAFGLVSIPIAGLHLGGFIGLGLAKFLLIAIASAGVTSSLAGYVFSAMLIGHRATWDLMEIYLFSPDRQNESMAYMAKHLGAK